ncbi:RNA polymerase primary sigma factor [Devosia enhydra]|uniref:RNA polymerase primary sigma factor n=1 Tax=Devosia enhydra TaxID=665118 RepID=A0A1K2HSD0_9HYPH|nr:RNA polymerase primary sigma factor [Devosia enhydra]
MVSGEVDWNIDLAPAIVDGDGMKVVAAKPGSDAPADDEFLVTQMRGKKSKKTATLPVGTRMSVDATYVRQVARDFLECHRVQEADVEALVTACSGNADADDSWRNATCILEAAGLELVAENDPALWDAPTVVDADELEEALASALTRNSQLPGRGRFRMDRADQEALLTPMLRAKDGLHLALVTSREAVRIILQFAEMVMAGQLKSEYFTLLAVYPSRENDPGVMLLREVSETLRSISAAHLEIEGKRRRLAIQGVEKLDLSSVFFQALGRHLSGQPGQEEIARNIHQLLGDLETITAKLIDAHLPYARRFASRYAEEGEDLEDVFQVAFTGLQKATRRFDPERETPFSLYATAWMRQTISRWRSDERSMIRIPVHRHSDLSALDDAMDRLSKLLGRTPTSAELAADREWSESQVEKLLSVPRVQVEWEEIGHDWGSVPPPQEAYIDQVQTADVIAEALSELDPRQADILRKRFGFDSGVEMTLEEVGQIYGVTRERIRQIEAKALRFLSNAARVRRLRALVGM